MTDPVRYIPAYTGQRIIMILVMISSFCAALLSGIIGVHMLPISFEERGYATVLKWSVLAGIPLAFAATSVFSALALIKRYRWAPGLATAFPLLVFLWIATIPVWFFT